MNSVQVIRGEGLGIVHEVLAIFSYGLKQAEEGFRNESVALTTLCDVDVFLGVALDKEIILEEEANEVKRFIMDPEGWA